MLKIIWYDLKTSPFLFDKGPMEFYVAQCDIVPDNENPTPPQKQKIEKTKGKQNN